MAAEGSNREGRAAGEAAQQNASGAGEQEGLQRLNRSWHIASVLHTERLRVLLPRRCAFLMPLPPALLHYIRQAGFEYAVQLRDFCFDAALLSTFV
ncbi:hypothetical protein PIB30_069315 [Stylosanthes scabra]|uniref:Uncharacterized protein n=1 Tax=Stylosanthes scabra TaxID=79078 RepID=A0ABU6XNV7_9FABA|nr:hypothetical protein [Stylosanthes scabra]